MKAVLVAFVIMQLFSLESCKKAIRMEAPIVMSGLWGHLWQREQTENESKA
jgi:hypothetical protein